MPHKSSVLWRPGRLPFTGDCAPRLLPALSLLLCLVAGAAFADPAPERKGGSVLLAVQGTRGGLEDQAAGPDTARLRGWGVSPLDPAEAPVGPGLVSRYRLALERESRRTLDRDPSLFWAESLDEEGYPLRRARREAHRIFDDATGSFLLDLVEDAIEEAASLHSARGYLDGVRLDVLGAGVVRAGGAGDDRFHRGRGEDPGPAGADVAASFSLIALGAPRLEIRATLPGQVRARFEVPLSSAGVRATFSRPFTSSLRGTVSLGAEDAGTNRWVTAGVGVKL